VPLQIVSGMSTIHEYKHFVKVKPVKINCFKYNKVLIMKIGFTLKFNFIMKICFYIEI
jgi:hypothetical protein